MLSESTEICLSDIEKRDYDIVWQGVWFPTPTFMGHYNSYSQDHPSNDKNLLIYPQHLQIPKHFGIQCIYDMHVEAHSSLWFPMGDFCLLSALHIDPFRNQLSLSKRLYAEPVQENLQFMVDYPEEASESARGNVAYSKLDSLPSGFNETSFINLCAIRAFPDVQMQRLIDALQLDWLPLREDIVRVALYVALGQLGRVTNGKVNFRHLMDGWGQLEERLRKQVERLRNTPRNHR